MRKNNVLALGEVLFDVIDDQHELGGAPFNVGAHMAKLGNESYILSAVGQDDLGQEIFRQAGALGVHTDFLHLHESLPTGTVQVTFKAGEPEYRIKEPVAWDELEGDIARLKSIDWSVIAFGSLAQRNRHNQGFYSRLFHEVNADWIYFDCNLRQDFYTREVIERSFAVCNIAKFNEDEVGVISTLLYGNPKSPEDFGRALNTDYGIEVAVYTWGKAGAKAWYRNQLHEAAGIKVKTKTTVGAGDAFSAGFLHSLVSGLGMEEALRHGNVLGAYVASHSGAIPEYSDEIRAAFE